MGDRPARIYREQPGQAYTRKSQKKSDNFIKGAPAPRITQYEQGATDKEFNTTVVLKAGEDCNIRSEALEAGRIAAQSYLSKEFDPEEDYKLKIKPFPHHVLRYHPLAGVAQADRYYEGMRKPFGRPIGRSAITDKDQEIITIKTNKDNIQEAKKALERSNHKMPITCRVKLKETTQE